MALFEHPFSLKFPAQIGNLKVFFFINENLYVSSGECISRPHNHSDFELRYTAAGTCYQNIGQAVFTGSPGDMILVHPMEYHWQSRISEDNCSCQYNLRFSLEPSSCAVSQQTIRAHAAVTEALKNTRLLHDETGTMLPYLQQLTKEMYEKRPGFAANVRLLCTLILTELLRLLQVTGESIFPKEEFKYRGYEQTMIDEFFRHKYLCDVTIADLAKEFNLSTRQINRIMQKTFGMSFSQKLTEMRLMEALRQIKTTKDSIEKISRASGFQSYSNFYSAFKARFHISPSEIRAKNNADTP